MDRLSTRGESPGWIYKHRAVAVNPQEIRVWGGLVVTESGKGESVTPHLGCFILDLIRLVWRSVQGGAQTAS